MAKHFAVSDVWNGDSLYHSFKERLENVLFLKTQARKCACVCLCVGWGVIRDVLKCHKC
jgi:hypothetical protein